MTEQPKEERIVPGCTLDFLAHGVLSWMRADKVDGEPAKNCQVFRGIVLSAPVGVLVEDNIENPMQLVLDGPMSAHDPQQTLAGMYLESR
jgi:hypothetical protein